MSRSVAEEYKRAVDVLLVVEFRSRTCAYCGAFDLHVSGCALNETLTDAGYPDRASRDKGRVDAIARINDEKKQAAGAIFEAAGVPQPVIDALMLDGAEALLAEYRLFLTPPEPAGAPPWERQVAAPAGFGLNVVLGVDPPLEPPAPPWEHQYRIPSSKSTSVPSSGDAGSGFTPIFQGAGTSSGCTSKPSQADARIPRGTSSGTLVEARAFAVERHGDQKYGDKPYVVHLDAVHDILARSAIPDAAEADLLCAAAYLHDLLEDTNTSQNEIRERFGADVTDLVWYVSTDPKRPRKERNEILYGKLTCSPLAIALKLADRIANVEACVRDLKDGGVSEKLSMYRREHAGFFDALRPNAPSWTAPLWDRLGDAIGVNPWAHLGTTSGRTSSAAPNSSTMPRVETASAPSAPLPDDDKKKATRRWMETLKRCYEEIPQQCAAPNAEGWWALRRDGAVLWVEVLLVENEEPAASIVGKFKLVADIAPMNHYVGVSHLCRPNDRWYGPVVLPKEPRR